MTRHLQRILLRLCNRPYFPENPAPLHLYRLRARVAAWCGAKLGRDVMLARNFRWQGGANLTIGDHAALSYNVTVLDFQPIRIGRFCRVGADVTFSNGAPGSAESQGDLIIGEGCWIGGGATIVGPVHIGDFAVVAAGSLVTSNVPEKAVAFGIPARTIWKRKVSEHIWYDEDRWYETSTFSFVDRSGIAPSEA